MADAGSVEVSVIIPYYNQAKYVREAVESVKAQTCGDWECIIIDDGSDEQSAKLAVEIANEDDRIRCVRQVNMGLAAARNTGLDEARGRYIQFLDSDDLIAPNKLELQLAAMSEATKPALAYCDYDAFSSENGSKILRRTAPPTNPANLTHDVVLRWMTEVSIPNHCFLFDARIFRDWGIRFDPSLRNKRGVVYTEDWDCWVSILARNPQAFYVDQKLALYRRHAESMSCKYDWLLKGWIKIIRKHIRLHKDDPVLCRLLKRKLRITRLQRFAFHRRRITRPFVSILRSMANRNPERKGPAQ